VLLQLVKAGLALGLFGGTHKFFDDKVVLSHRSCITFSDFVLLLFIVQLANFL